ncbi:MAG: hypothetical protein KatS3mg111_1343 [Pirellulaceae bacterium]|nr:MAG: hypothetical protein KatS3mg111_1343 [Pirellulaceae bacterium]
MRGSVGLKPLCDFRIGNPVRFQQFDHEVTDPHRLAPPFSAYHSRGNRLFVLYRVGGGSQDARPLVRRSASGNIFGPSRSSYRLSAASDNALSSFRKRRRPELEFVTSPVKPQLRGMIPSWRCQECCRGGHELPRRGAGSLGWKRKQLFSDQFTKRTTCSFAAGRTP